MEEANLWIQEQEVELDETRSPKRKKKTTKKKNQRSKSCPKNLNDKVKEAKKRGRKSKIVKPVLEVEITSKSKPNKPQKLSILDPTQNNIYGNIGGDTLEGEAGRINLSVQENNYFMDFNTRRDDSTINTEPFFEGIEKEVAELRQRDGGEQRIEIDLTDLLPLHNKKQINAYSEDLSNQSLNLMDDNRSQYEIAMRNNEWKMLSDNQRKSYERLHHGMVNARRNFELLRDGKLDLSINKIFDDFLDLLDNKDLMSIPAEILMTTRYGVLLNQIKSVLVEMQEKIPKNHMKLIRLLDVIIEEMKDKITNTFVVDENLAEKYNTRRISDRLLGKRSPIKHLSSLGMKNIKIESKEHQLVNLLGNDSTSEIINEIEEIMNTYPEDANIKQEGLLQPDHKSHSDFVKQLIGRIDYSLNKNSENKRKKDASLQLDELNNKKALLATYDAIKDVPIDEARRDARKKIEDIYCETCKMGGKDPQIYASVLENNLQQLCKDEECYDRAIQRFVSSIQESGLDQKDLKRLSYLSLGDLRMTLASFNIDEAI